MDTGSHRATRLFFRAARLAVDGRVRFEGTAGAGCGRRRRCGTRSGRGAGRCGTFGATARVDRPDLDA